MSTDRAHGRQKNGRRLWPPPKPYTPPDIPQGKINLTDLDIARRLIASQRARRIVLRDGPVVL